MHRPHQTKVGFAYGTNYLIDTQRAIIIDVSRRCQRAG
jgi:hypothetical protein